MITLSDSQILDILNRATVTGEHTDGGDSRLPKQDRGVLDSWTPWDGIATPPHVNEIRELANIHQDNDSRSEEDAVLLAIADLANRVWNDWCNEQHPDWLHVAISDVVFSTKI